MRFYWENSYFIFKPFLRFIIKRFKDVFDFFIVFVTLIIFLLSLRAFWEGELKNKNFFFFISLVFLIVSTVNFRKLKAKEDLRFLSAGEVNFDDFLNKEAKDFLLEKLTLAQIFQPQSFSLYLLKNFLKNKKIKKILKRAEINEELEKEIQLNFSKKKTEVILEDFYFDFVLKILKIAFDFSKKLNLAEINLYSLFLGLCFSDDFEVQNFLTTQRIDRDFLLSSVVMENFAKKFLFPKNFQPLAVFQKEIEKKKIFPLRLFSTPTPFLDKYGQDLTLIACKKNLGFLIGHDEESRLLEKYLSEEKNVILIGKEGSGKTTIIYNLAWKIHNELVKEKILDYRLIALDLNKIFEKHKEKFELIFEEILKELKLSKKIILFLQNFDKLLLNLEIYFEKLLNLKEVLLLATLNPQLIPLLNKKAEYLNFFEKIEVKSLNDEEALFLLTLKSLLFEKENKVLISPQAVVLSLKLSKTLAEEDYFKKAEELILKGIDLIKKNKGNFLSEEFIRELALSSQKEKSQKEILEFEEIFKQRIINQELALQKISKVLKRYYAGLKNTKILASFIFVGPIGVGKEEVAKMITKIIYGNEDSFLKIQGEELQAENDLIKIFSFLQKKEMALFYLNNFEKAKKEVLENFLKILEEGFLEFNFKKYDFKNSIIIFASNYFFEKNHSENLEEIIRKKIISEFSEELIKRVDDLVIFRELSFSEIFAIGKILIQKIKTDLLLKNNFYLEVDDSALEEIIKRSSFEKFGAEFLEKNLEDIIKDNLANLILRGELRRGEKIVLKFNKDFYLEKLSS